MVPLTGAGLSVPSGIPDGSELRCYLQLCVGMAVGIDGRDDGEGLVNWRPGTLTWPMRRGDWVKCSRKIPEQLKEIASWTITCPAELEESARAFQDLCIQAAAALTDWRLALQFICSVDVQALKRQKPSKYAAFTDQQRGSGLINRVNGLLKDHDFRFSLFEADPHLRDSLFRHITAHHSPSMGHRMLAHFANVLRMRVALTLNFDDLMEQAMREIHLDPAVFEVHRNAALPTWSHLGDDISLVKLHGGHWGLMADMLLDRVPSETDRRHFRSYLAGEDWPSDPKKDREEEDHLPARNCLLVAGVSGRDRRVRLFISDALSRIRGLKVYWCCYSQRDVDDVSHYFSKFLKESHGTFRTVRSTNLGLLFWELYLKVTRAPPPSGLEFPVSWQMPMLPTPQQASLGKAKLAFLRNSICKCLTRQFAGSKVQIPSDWNRMHLFEAFHRINAEFNALWIDVEDLLEPEDLLHRVLSAVEARLGLSHRCPPPVVAADGGVKSRLSKTFREELHLLLARSSRSWVLFVDQSGSEGYSAAPFHRFHPLPKGRPDNPDLWPPSKKVRLMQVLKLMAQVAPDMLVVVHARTKETQLDSICKESIKNLFANKNFGVRSDEFRFLRALAIFPMVRHQSALVSQAISTGGYALTGSPSESAPVTWKVSWDRSDAILDEFAKGKSPLVIRMPGAFLWMPSTHRDYLRKQFKSKDRDDPLLRADLHLSFADWNMTFFHATRDPLAAFHAIYHRCQTAKILRTYRGEDELHQTRARGALNQAIHHLKTAEAAIFARGYTLDAKRTLDGLNEQLQKMQEGAEARRSNDRATDSRFLFYARTELAMFKIRLLRDAGMPNLVLKECDALQNCLKTPLEASGVSSRIERAFLFLMIERASAAETLREYESAENYLADAAHRTGFLRDGESWDNVLDLKSPQAIWERVDRWVSQNPSRSSAEPAELRFASRRAMIRVLRRMAEINVLRAEVWAANLLHDVKDRSTVNKLDKLGQEQFLRRASNAWFAADTVFRHLDDVGWTGMRVERSRIHGLIAAVLAHRKDHVGVERRLNEAVLAAKSLPESEQELAWAVVDLRRVYTRLTQLQNIPLLRRTYRTTLGLPSGEDNSENDGESDQDANQLRLADALLDEIRIILDRISSRLANGRKTLWWWLTLARFQMVWYEQRELVRAIKRPTPSSDGADDAETLSRRDAEQALELLGHARRRVVSDFYQFSRIAHTWLNFCRLRKSRLVFDGTHLDREMELEKKRTCRFLSNRKGSNGIDQKVDEYVEHVIKVFEDCISKETQKGTKKRTRKVATA